MFSFKTRCTDLLEISTSWAISLILLVPSSSTTFSIASSLAKVVTVRKFHSVRFSFFADLAGVEGPWVPLMLGDAPSLLEHLESNLKSNEFSKLSLAVRLRVIACYRDRFVCVFSFPIPHPPVRLSLSLILSTLPSLLVFLVGFSSFSFRLAPAEEAAGIVPLSSQFQRDLYTVGFVRSRTLALRQKNFALSYLLLSSRPRVYRS
jgi:hypothetical protein